MATRKYESGQPMLTRRENGGTPIPSGRNRRRDLCPSGEEMARPAPSVLSSKCVDHPQTEARSGYLVAIGAHEDKATPNPGEHREKDGSADPHLSGEIPWEA